MNRSITGIAGLFLISWRLAICADHTIFNRALIDGDHKQAESIARRLLAQAEATTGPESPDALAALDMLVEAAVQGENVGEPEIERIAERIMGLKAKVFGPASPELALTLHLCANLFAERADYERSRPLHERAISIYQERMQPTSNERIRQLRNAWADYSILLAKMGDYSAAKSAVEHSVNIPDKALWPETITNADNLTNLGNAERELGDKASARDDFEQAIRIFDKKLGPGHIASAEAMANLGSLLFSTGEPAQARLLLERALAIRETTKGPNHPDVASTLQSLASVYSAAGQVAIAREAFRRALAIKRRSFGPDHPEVAGSQSQFAAFLARAGDASEALREAVSAENIGRRHLSLQLRTLPERQALAYAVTRPSGLGTLLGLAAANLADPQLRAEVVREAYDALIHSRAMVFDELIARQQSAIMASTERPDVALLFTNLAVARERLSRIVVRGPAKQSGDEYAGAIRRASEEVDCAERALAEKSIPLRQSSTIRRVGFAEVQAALPPDSVLVSYALYTIEGELNYVAFLLSTDGAPVAVALGHAADIDRWVEAVRGQIESEVAAAGHSSRRSEAAYRAAAGELRDRIWEPLEPWLGKFRHVFIVADGTLHGVNAAAFPRREGGYFVEGGRVFHRLATERDLLDKATRPGSNLLAMGNPAFTRNGSGAERPEFKTTARSVFRGARPGCAGFSSMQFAPLPESAREVREIAAIWRKGSDQGTWLKLESEEADETAFKLLAPGKRVLHIAAHGFFLGNDCVQSPGFAENPLLRSGLALAGANQRKGANGDDGILTAQEIASLNLNGVEWAVLSACQTGAGKFQASEGILGLERAFQLAGVRTVIMSLWAVDDGATRQWMAALYGNRFTNRATTAESVMRADLAVLNARRATKQSTHPFYWAGFVATGDWR